VLDEEELGGAAGETVTNMQQVASSATHMREERRIINGNSSIELGSAVVGIE
jgi:hypothetical protein